MPPRTSWSTLIPGLIGLTAIVALVVAVVLYAGVGHIRGGTRDVHVVAEQARGVMTGTEVWLSGQKIGDVDAISFRAPNGDTLGNVVLRLRVRKRDAELIRRNATVEVRSGANIVGPIVVYIRSGTPDSPALTETDTLYVRPATSVGAAVARLDEAMMEVDPLMADARLVMTNMRDPNGTIGAVLHASASGRGPMAELRAHVASFRQRRARPGPGLGDVTPHAKAALARVDSIRALIASPRSSFGRFRRDTTLGAIIAGVTEELSGLRAMLAGAEGTLPRAQRDSALMQSVAIARREMALLLEDIRKRPIRYLHF